MKSVLSKSILRGIVIVLLSGCATVEKELSPRVALPPPPRGPKKTIAVNEFENKSGYLGQANLGTGMADQLADALVQSGYFVVLERQIIEDVIKEQDFTASGRTADSETAQLGKVLPVQIVVQGAVTEFEFEESRGGQGISCAGISVSADRSNAHVGLIIRLVDTTTGRVIDSQRVEGKAEAGGLALGVYSHGVGFNTSGFKKTPLGKATQLAIDSAVWYIAEKMSQHPWEGKVVTVKDDDVVYINAGVQAGVASGDLFDIYRMGEPLIDPDTGINLGAEERLIGRIEVTEVQDKFAKALPVNGSDFQKGDVVRYCDRESTVNPGYCTSGD